MKLALIPVIAAAVGISACETLSNDMTPARLVDTGQASLATLADDVAAALDKPIVHLGPLAPDVVTTLSVLPFKPGSFEGNSPAIPRNFTVYEQGGECWLLEDGASTFYRLDGRACIPLNP